jgi:anti-sigma factor RsiW
MAITSHLNDGEMAEFLSNRASGVDTHLELCDACLDETSHLRKAVRLLHAQEADTKTEDFWTRQEEGINRRIAQWKAAKAPPVWRPLRAATLAVAAILVVAGALWQRSTPSPMPAPAQQVQSAEDQDLLLRVEQSVSQNGPEALAPAAMLAQEISPQDFSGTTDSNKIHKGEKQQ